MPSSQIRLHLLFVVIMVPAWAPLIIADDDFRYPEGRHGQGELKYFENVPVLIVRGSHAEMGEQIGTLALKPAAVVVDLITKYANQQIPKKVRPIADFAVQTMYAKFPAKYREELEAMANAAGVDQKGLMLANTIIDLQEMIGCSSLLVSENRSTTNGPLYGRNLDLPYVKGLAQFSLLIVYQPDNGNAFAMTNLPGFLMLASGINEKGLALGSQSVVIPRDGSPRFHPTGIASAVAGRRLMEECENVIAAHKWLEGNRLTRCVSIAACDPKRQLVMEVTTQRVLSRTDEGGITCATNHFRCQEIGGAVNCWRYSQLDAVQNNERLGIQEVANFMKATNQRKLTVHTMVFEPAALRIHLAMGPGPATDRPLTTINLSKLLHQEPSPKQSRSEQNDPTDRD